MGTGSFTNGKFNFVITSPTGWENGHKQQWQARFIEASRALYEATEGQMSFGDIFMVDDSWGMGHAEFVLNSFISTAYATYGGYGTLGSSVQLFAQNRTEEPRTIVHEFGHHAFALGDEYTGPVVGDSIDTENTTPAGQLFNTVTLLPSENDSQSLQFGFAILRFGGRAERLIVSEHSANEVTVFGSFSQDPHTADFGKIYYQPQYNFTYPEFPDGILIRCRGTGVNSANYCLMDAYREDIGNEAVTEFCSHDNHDHDNDTSHSSLHGNASCWEVMAAAMLERYDVSLTVPNPAVAGQQTSDFPFFYDLEKEARIVLVMDRSGSMGQNNKIEGARFGVEQWINTASVEEDWLSVIWFNETVDVELSLTQIADVQVGPFIDQVTDQMPTGGTNIRDSLIQAATQIQSRDGRAATQAIVLLTDGIHNRPEGTTIREAIPTLQDAGIPVYVIAVGSPESVDYDSLEELALETRGMMNAVGRESDTNGNPFPSGLYNTLIQLGINTVNALLRNGLVQVENGSVGEPPRGSEISDAIKKARGKRLKLKEWAILQGHKGVEDFIKKRRHPVSLSIPFLVEQGAQKAIVSIAYQVKQVFHLYLIDPNGAELAFDVSSSATLIAPESPFATAIVKKPKAGLWHVVVVRLTPGEDAHVNCVVGVENRLIVATADCDREVQVGQPTCITASAIWSDHLSNLQVSARLTAPDGSVHHVVLNDERLDEPQSGDYKGVFTPSMNGRYEGEVRIACNGKAVAAGDMHRVMHTPVSDKEGVSLDLRSKAPAFIRRVPLYFDAGVRPVPKDADDRFQRRQPRPPILKIPKKLKPLKLDDAMKHVKKVPPVGGGR